METDEENGNDMDITPTKNTTPQGESSKIDVSVKEEVPSTTITTTTTSLTPLPETTPTLTTTDSAPTVKTEELKKEPSNLKAEDQKKEDTLFTPPPAGPAHVGPLPSVDMSLLKPLSSTTTTPTKPKTPSSPFPSSPPPASTFSPSLASTSSSTTSSTSSSSTSTTTPSTAQSPTFQSTSSPLEIRRPSSSSTFSVVQNTLSKMDLRAVSNNVANEILVKLGYSSEEVNEMTKAVRSEVFFRILDSSSFFFCLHFLGKN